MSSNDKITLFDIGYLTTIATAIGFGIGCIVSPIDPQLRSGTLNLLVSGEFNDNGERIEVVDFEKGRYVNQGTVYKRKIEGTITTQDTLNGKFYVVTYEQYANPKSFGSDDASERIVKDTISEIEYGDGDYSENQQVADWIDELNRQ